MGQSQETTDKLLQRSLSLFESESSQTPVLCDAEDTATPRFLIWWYRWFAPTLPLDRVTTMRERENVRRGRLASLILLVQFVLIEIPVFRVIVSAPNHAIILPWYIIGLLALICAIFFNRHGHLTVAGLLMVSALEVTLIVKIITIPGGINLIYLTQFDLLVQAIIIAAALLKPWSAFVVGGFNIFFIIMMLIFGPHAPDLTRALHDPAQVDELFAVPIATQVVITFFCYIIVKNMLQALKQADRAKQVAALERSLLEARMQDEERARQLEIAANAIVTTIQQVSNHDIGARIELPIENILWPLGMQVNLFLDRYQKGREAEVELEITQAAINEFAQEIYRSHQQGRMFRLPPRRNTILDGIIVALSGKKKVY